MIFSAGIVAAALVYTAITVFVTPTYESRVSFYVYNSANNDAHDTINNSDLQAAESLAATYSKILESNSVLDSVLADMRGETALSRKELNRMVQVSVISDTQLLEVVVTSADPKLACRIADAFATVAPTEIVRITKAGGVEVVDRPEVAPEKTAPRTGFDSVIGFVLGVIVISVILVLRLMAQGMSNDEIADKLGKKTGTIKFHSNNIFRKLQVQNRQQAVNRGREIDLLA